MALVKICGITNTQDAQLACELGADALGFIFYEKSRRAMSPAVTWKIIRVLPPFITTVGVFVNWTPAAVITLAHSLHLSAAQLHGDESLKDIDACAQRIAVIRAFRVSHKFSLKSLESLGSASAFLFDAPAEDGQYGGTGRTFDWDVARRAATSHRIILAGGLTPANVYEAIRIVRPYAVDVTSGVESHPGKKDPAKLRDFFREVDRANRELAPPGLAPGA